MSDRQGQHQEPFKGILAGTPLDVLRRYFPDAVIKTAPTDQLQHPKVNALVVGG